MLRVSFHFHFLAVFGAVSFFFFAFAFVHLSLTQESRSLYTQFETTLVSQFLSLLFSLGVRRGQILPTVGCGLCGGDGDNGIGLVGGCVNS